MMQEALAPLLMVWLAEATTRMAQWKEQLDTLLDVIRADKDLTEEACRSAGEKQRADFLAKSQRPATAGMTAEEAYAEGLVEALIAASSGSRTSVSGMPSILFHRREGGRPPSNTTGMLVVHASEAGAQRRKTKLKRLKAAAGALETWAFSSEIFQRNFEGVRRAKVEDLQAALQLQLQLLQISEAHAKKNLGGDARTAQGKVIVQQKKLCGILYDRLVAWMNGGFFGLRSMLPEGWGGAGSSWSKDGVLVDKNIPWGEGDGASLRGGALDYGCVHRGRDDEALLDNVTRFIFSCNGSGRIVSVLFRAGA